MTFAQDDKYEYVALGDSISTGFGLAEFKRFSKNNAQHEALFVNMISESHNLKTLNLATDTFDSTNLLDLLNELDEKSQQALLDADLITVSIGGNNIFEPMLKYAAEKAAQRGPISVFNNKDFAFLEILQKPTESDLEFIKNTIDDGFARFEKEFPEIVKFLRKNEEATLIFLNLYNPYPHMKNLPDEIDVCIKDINKIIADNAEEYDYTVVDLYEPFTFDEEFSMINMFRFDPHPNVLGNEFIYSALSEHLEKLKR